VTTQPLQTVQVPDPPRRVPRWFFVRRMQALLFCGVIFTVSGGGVLGIFAAASDPICPLADWELNRHAQTTTGHVTGTRLVEHTRSGSRHPWQVRFEFRTPDGSAIAAAGYTWDAAIGQKAPGDPLDVEFDPRQPAKARPVGGSVSLLSDPTLIFVPLMFAAEVVIGAGMLAAVAVQAAKERKLLAYGMGTTADIESVRRVGWIHFGSRSPYNVRYRFADYRGQEVRGKDRTYRYGWAEGLRPGDAVGVVYHPLRPSRNVLWLHG